MRFCGLTSLSLIVIAENIDVERDQMIESHDNYIMLILDNLQVS